MNILCINTAFPKATVVLETERATIIKEIDAKAKSSEKVLPCIEEILYENELEPKDLDLIGVVVGPGSFTGLRIGIALVKGFMSVFKDLKVIAINSLDLMAYQLLQIQKIDKNFYCIQNALSGRFFVANYNLNAELIDEYKLINELPDDLLIGLELENLDMVDIKINITGKTLLSLTKEYYKRNKLSSIENLNPVYLRLSQAEENLIKKHNKINN